MNRVAGLRHGAVPTRQRAVRDTGAPPRAHGFDSRPKLEVEACHEPHRSMVCNLLLPGKQKVVLAV